MWGLVQTGMFEYASLGNQSSSKIIDILDEYANLRNQSSSKIINILDEYANLDNTLIDDSLVNRTENIQGWKLNHHNKKNWSLESRNNP